jgi:MYXO-CTERM domain-containing protein
MRPVIASIVLLAAPAAAIADVYRVGPGLDHAEVDEVPFEALGAGDVVEIHGRATPYRSKLVIGNGGTASAPLIVRGIRGADGARPVIDGDGATTRAALDYWNQVRSVIKVGGSNRPSDAPSHVVIEGLDVRGGHPDHRFTDSSGVTRTYAGNAAAIHVENGAHITIRDCVVRDSANGLFVSSETSDVLVEGNHVHGNGVIGDIYVHNSYTEADGIVFQFNHYGSLAPGASGNNLKDRSAGTVVRYNWIEGGNRQLDLVESDVFAGTPAYATTLVYGNVLVEPDGAGNRQIVHYGGDNGDEAIYRKGTLHFYGNTVVSTRADRTTLFRLSSAGERADVRNNIFFVTAAGGDTELVAQHGDLDWGWNWIKPGFVDSFAGATGTIRDLGGRVEGADPGFVDLEARDLHLRADAAARDVGGPLADGVPALDREYVAHERGQSRGSDGALDLGAFERCDDGCALPPDAGDPGGGGGADAGAGCGCRGGEGGGGGALLVVAIAGLRRRRVR